MGRAQHDLDQRLGGAETRGGVACVLHEELTNRANARIGCGKLEEVKPLLNPFSGGFLFSRAADPQRVRNQAAMNKITPEEHVSQTAELLQSLHSSIRRLRQNAETMCNDLANGADADTAQATRQIASVEGLIRICQKVESSLVEQYHKQTGSGPAGAAFDLDEVRSEIGRRLDRLRATGGEDQVSE